MIVTSNSSIIAPSGFGDALTPGDGKTIPRSQTNGPRIRPGACRRPSGRSLPGDGLGDNTRSVDRPIAKAWHDGQLRTQLGIRRLQRRHVVAQPSNLFGLLQ